MTEKPQEMPFGPVIEHEIDIAMFPEVERAAEESRRKKSKAKKAK